MRTREYFARRSLSLAAGLVVLSTACATKAVDIQIDTATKYQTLSGWESILSGFEVKEDNTYSPAWIQQAPKIMPFLVNEMGVNRVRVELPSGSENPHDYFADFQAGRVDYNGMKAHFYEKINDNGDANSADAAGFHFGLPDFRIENELLPIKQAVEANGEKLYINVCYVDFKATQFQGSLHHGKTPAEYAELVTVFFDHLKTKYGITPDALEIILEPENTNDWSGGDIGRAAVAAAARLKAAGHNPTFIGPSTVSAADAVGHFNDATAVSGASNLFSMLSYHRYTGGDYAAIYQAARAKGAQTGMLEFYTAGVDDLVQDLTVANVSAWEKYAIAAPKPDSDYAYLYANVTNPTNPVVSFGSKSAQMMPYFRFARMGAVRVGVTSNSGGITPVAFVNTNGTHVVVVKGDGAALTVKGIRNAVYGVRSVAGDGKVTNAADVTATGGTLNVTVPSGVTAIYDKDALKGGGSSGTGGATGAGGGTGAGGSSPAGGTTGSGGNRAGGTTGSGGATTGSGGTTTASGGRAASSSGGTTGGSASGAPSSPDGGTALAKQSDDSGCGCRVPGSRRSDESVWLAILGGSVVAARFARNRYRRP